MRVDTT